MYQINLDKPCKVYFIGIGGISMSGFAKLFFENGFSVSGSDIKSTDVTRRLEASGIHVIYGQKSSNIPKDADFVVYTAAVHHDNPEFVAAKSLGIPMLDRAEMIGQIMKNYDNAIAVAGTHGKTTATSMISHIFLSAGKDPTISVGGILDAIGGNIRIGHSQNFITEACEYTNSFLKFHPTAGVILNVDADHLDFFKDIDDIRSSFRRFAGLLPRNGVLAVNGAIDKLEWITKDVKCKIITFGDDPSYNYSAVDVAYDENGCASFNIARDGIDSKKRVFLKVPGRHNILNSLAAIAISEFYVVPFEAIADGLSSFRGAQRRFQIKGKFNGVTVIDDYAHHPAEIEATLTAVERYPHNHLWCVFQPHTYSRTRSLLSEMAKSLSLAENVILTDIYAAREADPGDVSSLSLLEEMKKNGKDALYFSSFEEIENFLEKACKSGDAVITMGAGDVCAIGDDILKKHQ